MPDFAFAGRVLVGAIRDANTVQLPDSLTIASSRHPLGTGGAKMAVTAGDQLDDFEERTLPTEGHARFARFILRTDGGLR